MRRIAGVVPLGVTLLIAVGAVMLLAFSSSLNPIDALLGRGAVVAVPDFEGRAQPRAVAEAENAGLIAVVEDGYSLKAPRGTVIRQEPAAGEQVREGSEVTLTVSRGAQRVEMPDAVGKQLDDVVPPLEDAGVPIDVVEVASETVPDGIILTQEPGPGVQVTGEDQARFEVSTGADDRPVPEIVGLTVEAAGFELGVAGLTLGELAPTADADVPLGAVVSTAPAPGAVVAKDTPVRIVYSLGPTPVVVPDVTNRAASQAVSTLESLGFEVVRAGRLVASDAPGGGAGAVFQQFPPAGTELQPGRPVTIVVGRVGPPPPPPVTSTTVPATTTTGSTTTTAGG